MTQVIHMWSTPMSLDVNLMYSFAQRDDTQVLDEPLYANYIRIMDVQRPYRSELLLKTELDGNNIVKDVINSQGPKKYRFCKHMAKQMMPVFQDDLLKQGKHFILIRNPIEILPLFDKVVPVSFDELGLTNLVSIYSGLRALGKTPPIIDAAELLQDPEAVLRGLCDDLDIPFKESMLKWEAGPRSIDGIWAPWWYESAHNSTGFKLERLYPLQFPTSLYQLLEHCHPLYNILKSKTRGLASITRPLSPTPSLPIPTNEKILVWVGDEIVPREMAKISVFDSIIQEGDAVFEEIQVYTGKVFKLNEHLHRLLDSAEGLAFNNVPSHKEIKEAILKTLILNGMFDNARVTVILTRGEKVTSEMNPLLNLYGCTLVVLAEWKLQNQDNAGGITLVTSYARRSPIDSLSSKIRHTNLISNNLAKVRGNLEKADEVIMLDEKQGFVSETNASNIFLVKRGHVATPHADYCFPSIPRETVMELVVKENLVLEERHIGLLELYAADEVFTTGTMGELRPVKMIDGRIIGDGKIGPVTKQLQALYKTVTAELGEPIPVNTQL